MRGPQVKADHTMAWEKFTTVPQSYFSFSFSLFWPFKAKTNGYSNTRCPPKMPFTFNTDEFRYMFHLRIKAFIRYLVDINSKYIIKWVILKYLNIEYKDNFLNSEIHHPKQLIKSY